jgi:16S rRNA processing protein RimM
VTEASPRDDERLVVALVRGVHGLDGAIRVEILTDRPEERYAPRSVLFREGSDRPLTVTRSSAIADGPGWRLQFAEIRDRAAAEALRGAYLEIAAGPDAVLPRGAYFWHEVIGSTVTATDGTVLGTVRDVYRSGGAEVYVVDGGPYGEFDVPGVRDYVRIFAPKRDEIVVDVDALDLGPPKRRGAPDDPDRPRAPRRRPGPRRPKGEGSRTPDRAEETQAADSPEAHSPDAGS